jgi:hypothetical protein
VDKRKAGSSFDEPAFLFKLFRLGLDRRAELLPASGAADP